MGGACASPASLLPCLSQLRQGAPAVCGGGSAASGALKPRSLLLKRNKQMRLGGPAAECDGCGLRTEELAKSSGGRLLCRSCTRADDEEKLAPLTPEEQRGLDLVSGVLDAVSWSYWKPGRQPARILDWLYLGDVAEATDLDLLERSRIGAVLNLIGWWELTALLPEDTSLGTIFGEWNIDYEEADSEDRLFFDIVSLCWPAAEQFLERCRYKGRRVLVNCHAGHNRSACIVVCWLVMREGFTLLEALDHVQRLRGTILSNHGFRLQLVRMALEHNRLGEPDSVEKAKRSGRTRAASKEISTIINRKRLSTKYDHNSKEFSRQHAPEMPRVKGQGLARESDSVISSEVKGLISQRKLSLELLACLVHWKKHFLDDYEYTEDTPVVVGTGFSGEVVLCQRRRARDLGGRPQNSLRCVKRFHHRNMAKEHLEKLKNEAVIYLSLEHPHIARLFDVYENEHELSLVMQYCGGGTLEDVIRTVGPFSEADFNHAAFQMLRVLSYIHRAGIVHRDIKPRNWVYEAERNVLKLIDFGFSAKRLLLAGEEASGGASPEEPRRSFGGCLGTLGYLAPEVVQSWASEEAYTEKCDIWSLAVVFYEMLAGETAFHRERGTCDGYTEEVVLRDIQDVCPEDVSRLCSAAPEGETRALLQKLMVPDPVQRLSAMRALREPVFLEARKRLLAQPGALPVEEVLARFRAYGAASAPTRASVLALARAPTRLPWHDFCTLRATFDVFDARKLTGTVDLEAFLAVVCPSADGHRDREDSAASGEEDASSAPPSSTLTSPASPVSALALPPDDEREEALQIWRAVCGREQSLSYCEFLAALIPFLEDAFEDVGTAETDHPEQSQTQSEASAVDQRLWDLSKSMSTFSEVLASRRDIQSMIFSEAEAVRDVVFAMNAHHFRWVVVRFNSGRHEFFDYMDLCHKIVTTVGQRSVRLAGAVADIGSLPVGLLANCSGYSAFIATPETASLQSVLTLLSNDRATIAQNRNAKGEVHRVPLFDAHGRLKRIFSCLDFLDLALRFDTPSAVLRSRDARTFDRRNDVLEQLSVPHDESVLHALRMMDAEQLTICPATSRELSGDLGGAVAVGVIAVADLKWVMTTGEFHMLDRSIDDFMAWRNELVNIDSAKVARQKSLQRFNVVSVDRNETLMALASRLKASNLQRIFLSSDEIARIVGIVSSRDILIEVLDQLIQTHRCFGARERRSSSSPNWRSRSKQAAAPLEPPQP
eukprot:TRINITY_DN18604_c0_g2_i1.p1 TRINITY_DN18604_c0_g2~~TRINITY_DN18604_c0_g2_i1.p1  ORF type:complete len:1227 (-),score=308.73 TRINITY_DN18604_c0_g2_i1:43-3723(-)